MERTSMRIQIPGCRHGPRGPFQTSNMDGCFIRHLTGHSIGPSVPARIRDIAASIHIMALVATRIMAIMTLGIPVGHNHDHNQC